LAKTTGLLIFRPYYTFEYKLNSVRMDRRGKTRRIRDEGHYVVDAITEGIVHENGQDGLSNADQMLFSKKSKDESEYEKMWKKRENGQACLDLKNIRPKIHYNLQENPDYSINTLEPNLSMKAAIYMVLEDIIDSNIKEVSYDTKTSGGELKRKQ
jgi:hypothetical protein